MQNIVSTSSNTRPTGSLVATKLNRSQKVGNGWTIRNRLSWRFISGLIASLLANGLSSLTALLGARIVTMTSELSLQKRTWTNDIERETFMSLRRAGKIDESEEYARLHAVWVDHGVVSRRVLTDAFVTYLRDDLNNAAGSADVSLFNFHGCGTGTNAEAAGDTALQTESTTALNPDSTRATGTRATPASNQYRSTGTLTFDAGAAVTEHGLFTTSGTGTGTLADRSVFSAINVVSGDSIAFQYTITLTSGG